MFLPTKRVNNMCLIINICIFIRVDDLNYLKDYDMSIIYHPHKSNVAANALNWLSMGSIAHVEENKKELVWDFRWLVLLVVQLVDSTKGGVVVHNDSKSYFVAHVKVKQGLDQSLVELKGWTF